MYNYELTVILRNKEVDSLVSKTREILGKYGVNVVKEEATTRKLAYQIDGEKEGYYLFWNVQSTEDSVKKINNEFNLQSDILRYMFIKADKPSEPAQ